MRSGGAVTNPFGGPVINHNLGANQAAYAGVLPLLNTWLQDLYNLEDSDTGSTILDQYTVHLDLRLGCKASDWTGFINGNKANNDAICKDVQIDSGYEQLFLVGSNSVLITVPEPGTLALVGAALAGLALSRRRREQV